MKRISGITLIALVVTIIVLLILAGVTLSLVIGNNGIVNRASDAKEQMKIGEEKEGIGLAAIEVNISDKGYTELTEQNFQKAIDNRFGEKRAIVIENGDGTYTIKFIDSNRTYSINAKEGKIEQIKETEEGSDIYVAFYAQEKALKFASQERLLSTINEANGDINYGNIKWKVYASQEIKDDAGNTITIANTPWFEQRENIMNVEIIDKITPTNTKVWFYKLSNIKTINVENIDTSKCINMRGMFSECNKLVRIENLNSFDTSQVTNMYCMFYNCNQLEGLDLSSFNTSKVTNMHCMFFKCNKLATLDVSSFNTSQVNDMYAMFYQCNELTTLDLSSFNTSKVTNMYGMFYNCNQLTSLDLSGFDTSKVTNMYSMFYNCKQLVSLNLSSFNTSQVNDMYAMFYGCNSLTTLDVSNFDTSKITNMYCMFYDCNSLTTLNLSSFNTSKVTNMYAMFWRCNSLTTLDVSNFDTSRVTNMYGMFARCENLSLDCSGWNTQNVTEREAFNYLANKVIAPW